MRIIGTDSCRCCADAVILGIALTVLAKSNQVRREGGKYYHLSSDQSEAELPLDDTDRNPLPEAGSGIFQG